jgi:hypothetical protein
MMDIPLDATEYWPENLSGQPPPDELKYSVRIKPDNPVYDQERAVV